MSKKPKGGTTYEEELERIKNRLAILEDHMIRGLGIFCVYLDENGEQCGHVILGSETRQVKFGEGNRWHLL